MIYIKTEKEIEILRKGGKILSETLHAVSKKVKPGVSVLSLDSYAKELLEKKGGRPSFLGYTPEGISYPYPASLCVSINDEIVHGIPKNDVILKEGDIVSLDLGLEYMGMYTDMAITVPVGEISDDLKNLLSVTEKALFEGINSAYPKKKTGDIGFAIEKFVNKYGYGIVRELSGHGVGKYIHEDPYVPNYGKKGTGAILKPGMVIAIEPMLNLGTEKVSVLDDEYTWVTRDGLPSAHFEKTILITRGKPEILTP